MPSTLSEAISRSVSLTATPPLPPPVVGVVVVPDMASSLKPKHAKETKTPFGEFLFVLRCLRRTARGCPRDRPCETSARFALPLGNYGRFRCSGSVDPARRWPSWWQRSRQASLDSRRRPPRPPRVPNG